MSNNDVARLNEQELERGIAGNLNASWHRDYRDTSWVFVGGLAPKLSEGDVICVLSQVGEVEDLHLVRDDDTGQSKGFGYLKFESFESSVLAVDNFNGVELVGRTLRVDHARYERPKRKREEEAEMTIEDKALAQQPGHAYRASNIEIEGEFDINRGHDVFAPTPTPTRAKQGDSSETTKPSKKDSKTKKNKKNKTKKNKDKKKGEDEDEDAKKKMKKMKKRKGKERKEESKKRAKREEAGEEQEEEQGPESASAKRMRLAALASQPAASWKG